MEFRNSQRYARSLVSDPNEKKVWINPRFDQTGNVVDWHDPQDMNLERQDSNPSTEDTSVWLLEGPMIGDLEQGQLGVVAKAKTVEHGIGLAISNGEEMAKAYASGKPRLQRIWASKSLPPLPTGGRPGDWV